MSEASVEVGQLFIDQRVHLDLVLKRSLLALRSGMDGWRAGEGERGEESKPADGVRIHDDDDDAEKKGE